MWERTHSGAMQQQEAQRPCPPAVVLRGHHKHVLAAPLLEQRQERRVVGHCAERPLSRFDVRCKKQLEVLLELVARLLG